MKKAHLLCCLIVSLLPGATLFAESALTGATTEYGSPPHFVMSALSDASEAAGYGEIVLEYPDNVALSQVNVAKETLDFATIPVITTLLMRRGFSPFRSIGAAEGQRFADQLRAIGSFNAGVYHVLTFADSGIDDWDDLRDKRIFVGTEKDNSSVLVQRLIKLVTGYKAGRDYSAVKMDWSEGMGGLIDGDIDVVIRPGAAPADFVERAVASSGRKLRIVGIPAEIAEGGRYRKFSTTPGTLPSFVPEKLYDRDHVEIINGGSTIALMMAIVVNGDLDHDLVYAITKAYIASIGGLSNKQPWVNSLLLDVPFSGLHAKSGLKLHSGAKQAWREAGFSVPEHLH